MITKRREENLLSLRPHLCFSVVLTEVSSHLKRTVEFSGEFDQLFLHRLADGASVAMQSDAVHQQKAAGRRGCDTQLELLFLLH